LRLALQFVLAAWIDRLPPVAESMHSLGCESEMAHHWNTHADEAIHNGNDLWFSTFKFDGSGIRLFENGSCSGDGAVKAALITQEWKIAYDEGTLGERFAQSTAYGLAVMKHLFQRDRKSGLMAKNHHRE
jgi:hypothetical protein